MAGTKGKSKSKGNGKIKSNKKQSRLAFIPVEQSSSPSSSRQTESSQSAFTPSKLRYANPFTGKVTIKGQLQLEDYTRSWGNSASISNQTELENGIGRRRSTMESEVYVRQSVYNWLSRIWPASFAPCLSAFGWNLNLTRIN